MVDEIETIITSLRSDHPEQIREASDLLKQGRYLSNGSLSGRDLRGVNLQMANMVGANLSDCVLDGIDFSGTRLVQVTLKGASLRGATFSGAAIYTSDLRTCDFHQADMKDADMRHTDLTGALNLTEEQLRQARSLRAVTLPDGQIYDGCYNLPFDIEDARLHKVNTDDPAAMADWYGVSEEVYLKGQEKDR